MRTAISRRRCPTANATTASSPIAEKRSVPVLPDGVADEGPRSLAIVGALLSGAGLAACLVPVRRALAIQPATAMKSE
jgi:hypothetical protein